MIAVGLLIPTKPNLLPIFLPVIHFHLSLLHLCKHLLWVFYHQSTSPSGLRRMDTCSNLRLVITPSMTEKILLSCSLVVPTKETTIMLTRRRCVFSQVGLLTPQRISTPSWCRNGFTSGRGICSSKSLTEPSSEISRSQRVLSSCSHVRSPTVRGVLSRRLIFDFSGNLSQHPTQPSSVPEHRRCRDRTGSSRKFQRCESHTDHSKAPYSPWLLDRLRWYCRNPAHTEPTIIREEVFHVENLGYQLKPYIQAWMADENLRKCKECGTIAPPK